MCWAAFAHRCYAFPRARRLRAPAAAPPSPRSPPRALLRLQAPLPQEPRCGRLRWARPWPYEVRARLLAAANAAHPVAVQRTPGRPWQRRLHPWRLSVSWLAATPPRVSRARGGRRVGAARPISTLRARATPRHAATAAMAAIARYSDSSYCKDGKDVKSATPTNHVRSRPRGCAAPRASTWQSCCCGARSTASAPPTRRATASSPCALHVAADPRGARTPRRGAHVTFSTAAAARPSPPHRSPPRLRPAIAPR